MKLAVGLSILGAAQTAAAERIIAVDAPGAPFEARELVAAIRVRAAVEGAPVRVRVTAIEHGVRVEARGAVRDIDLTGLTGAPAARLVALAADDLLLDDLATAPVDRVRTRPVVAGTRSLGVIGTATGWDGGLGALAIDLAIPRGAWLAAVEVGGGQLVNSPLQLTAGVVRASVGMRTQADWVELRAGLTAVPLFVSTGAGDRTVLVGGGASARLRVPIVDGVRCVFALGADAFATRTEYRNAGMPTLTTPRWAPWLGAGIEVGL